MRRLFFILYSTLTVLLVNGGTEPSAFEDSLSKVVNSNAHDTVRVQALLYWEAHIVYTYKHKAIRLAKDAIEICDRHIKSNSEPESVNKFFKKKKGNALFSLAAVYHVHSDLDSALHYYKQCLQFQTRVRDYGAMANVNANMGVAMWGKGRHNLAIEYYEEALHLYEKVDSKRGMAKVYNNLGNVYSDFGEYSKCIEHYLKSLKIKEELGTRNIASTLLNIGSIYLNQGDADEALKYYEKALDKATEEENEGVIAHCYDNIGDIFLMEKNYDQSLSSYEQGLQIRIKINDELGQSNSYNNMSEVHRELKEFDKALSYAKRSLELRTAVDAKRYLASSYNTLSALELSQGNYRGAISHGIKAAEFAEEQDNPAEKKDAVESLYLAYKKSGNNRQALIMFEEYVSLKDTLLNIENQREVDQQRFRSEYEIKLVADSLKDEEEKKLKNLVIERQNLQLEKEKTTRYAFIIGIILLIVFLIAMYNRFRLIRKQKNVIQGQQETILESINYSGKIQNALLPEDEVLAKTFKDEFVLFVPKDIVSGDFYWMRNFEDRTVIACVDCTGHGVPGGFMSTIGSLLLNKIVQDKSLSTSEILHALSNEIIQTLKQESGGDLQDGMDISVCMIDHAAKTVSFSGARNGIVVVEDGKATTHNADFFPVGGYYVKKGKPIVRQFEVNTIPIKKDTMIFMFTDGYFEQPGGEKNLPMDFDQFNSLLVNASDHSNPIQYLQTEFDSWRGDQMQVDDVLIIGYRFRN